VKMTSGIIDPLAKSTDLVPASSGASADESLHREGVIRRRWTECGRRSVKLEAAF
jgi:hypothetical protein